MYLMRERLGEITSVSIENLHSLRNHLDELQRLEPSRGDFITNFERLRRELQTIDARLQFIEAKAITPSLKQLAKETLGKRKLSLQVEFHGESLGLSREIMDVVQEACIHLVRNSIDHGGKDRKKLSIALQCSVIGGQIEILFQDNGNGVNWSTLKKRARQLGIVGDAKKLLSLLFLPGFSTRTKTSKVSGRGIGLSAVRSAMKRIQGRVEPLDLKKGFGVRLMFPITEFGAWVRLVEIEGKSFFLPRELYVETESHKHLNVQSDELLKSVKFDFRVFHLCTPKLIGNALAGSEWFLKGERGFAARMSEKKLALLVSSAV